MAVVGRLHPRHWDGHRLLQFLTGLALLALAFGTTAACAAPASPPAAAVTTTVEAPTAPTATALDVRAATAATAAARDDKASATLRTTRHAEECHHDAGQVGYTVPPTADAPGLAGVAQQAHGSRAPPR